MPHGQPRSGSYQLGISIHACPGQFGRSKMLTISHRVVLCNQVNRERSKQPSDVCTHTFRCCCASKQESIARRSSHSPSRTSSTTQRSSGSFYAQEKKLLFTGNRQTLRGSFPLASSAQVCSITLLTELTQNASVTAAWKDSHHIGSLRFTQAKRRTRRSPHATGRARFLSRRLAT